MDETKLRAVLQEVWAQAQQTVLSKKIFSKRLEVKKRVLSKAITQIQVLLPSKIPVYKSEELAEAMDGGDLLKHQLGGPVLDIDLRGGDGKT